MPITVVGEGRRLLRIIRRGITSVRHAAAPDNIVGFAEAGCASNEAVAGSGVATDLAHPAALTQDLYRLRTGPGLLRTLRRA
ncbi:hypothetical protein [Streptomyces gardneri]|uniref:hypothetical protein n=1 Tax=Streptomyces gardneri TaxID=66892 RepID=UPI0034102E38